MFVSEKSPLVASAPPLPPPYSVDHQWNIRSFVKEKASSNTYDPNEWTHRAFEGRLWIANCFIIPLIVYPIVALIGHAVIELTRDKYYEAYKKISAYLEGKEKLIQAGKEYQLDDQDIEKITTIFTDSLGFHDSQLKNDPLYQKLSKINPATQQALALLDTHIQKCEKDLHAIQFDGSGDAAAVEYLKNILSKEKFDQIKHAWDSNTKANGKQYLKSEINAKTVIWNKLKDVQNSRNTKLHAALIKEAGFMDLDPESEKLELFY